MIGNHYFRSVGGIYVGMEKDALGKYQEKDFHTPLQKRYASGTLMEDGTVRPTCFSKKDDYSSVISYSHDREQHKAFHSRTAAKKSSNCTPEGYRQV